MSQDIITPFDERDRQRRRENAEMKRESQLVHFQAFAVAERFTLKSLQFLPNGQKCALYVARGKAF
jgi:hypothetical protein